MKFIISSMSIGGMFNNPSFDLKVHEISEEEFQMLALDGYSCIGQKDIADAVGFAYNKEPVSARVGDVLLLVNKYYKGKLRFHCIQVVESEAPLTREIEMEA